MISWERSVPVPTGWQRSLLRGRVCMRNGSELKYNECMSDGATRTFTMSALVGWRPLASQRVKSELRYAVCLPRSPTHTHTQLDIISVCADCTTHTLILTCEDFDGYGLFLLDGLRVREAGVADVVVPRILSEDVGEVKIPVQGLRYSATLGKPLEVWG